MSKISNTITFMNLLSTGKKYSIKELSDILEVTPRMIRIYKTELEKAGIYIDTMMGPYGGYVLNQSIRVPKRKFKKVDYLLLNKYIDNSPKEEQEKLILLQDKIRGIYLGSKLEEQEIEKDNETTKKLNILSRAIKEKRQVRITYYSYGKGETERTINPLDMFLYENGWYCAAYCNLRNDIRHFELKRIRKLKLLDKIF